MTTRLRTLQAKFFALVGFVGLWLVVLVFLAQGGCFDNGGALSSSGFACAQADGFEVAETAWGKMGVPKEWLPFIEDNSDYFLISQTGEVKYWSHNGTTNEKWPNFAAWFQQVCVERR